MHSRYDNAINILLNELIWVIEILQTFLLLLYNGLYFPFRQMFLY